MSWENEGAKIVKAEMEAFLKENASFAAGLSETQMKQLLLWAASAHLPMPIIVPGDSLKDAAAKEKVLAAIDEACCEIASLEAVQSEKMRELRGKAADWFIRLAGMLLGVAAGAIQKK